jgi:DNA polymerase elongation subunit (family B)
LSYVDAMWNKDSDTIYVVERHPQKGRLYQQYPAKYLFYYPDSKGKFRSIYDKPLSRVLCKTYKEFQKEQRIHSSHKLLESDVNPVFRCLEDNYLGNDSPTLNTGFFDIEVDFSPELGYASPEDAFMPITAIAVHLQWMDTMVCFAVPPKSLTIERARELVSDIPNTFIFETEKEVLEAFLDIIDDADLLSGWNSEGFDIPYTVNRVIKVLGKEATKRFCLWGQYPKKREYEKYGKKAITYDLVGRVHLDSLELYRKYNYEERHSYRLDAIGEMEIGETKTVYEGTLDQLYNNDFRKFIEYNRQDCALLDKLDKKLRFIDLANAIAHENTVLLQTTMGAVAVTEQAIINESHHLGMIVPNRVRRDDTESTQAAGAYVAYPQKGLHDWIGTLDINSLYPSVIRALNMGPETIIGQLRPVYTKLDIDAKIAKGESFAGSWEGKFGSDEYELVMSQDITKEIHVDWENGTTDILSGAQIYEMIFDSNQPWMLSANGTIFTHEREGIIPGLLKRWYAERKEMQKKMRDAIESGDKVQESYWDKRQLVKKIGLNSLYGAILNAGCRFFDSRIGQSTTLTGRQIAKHMAAKVNEVITGKYDHRGETIIYGDTDSCIFSAYPVLKKDIDAGKIVWNRDSVVQVYNSIGDEVNATFQDFMFDSFHCPKTRGEVIKAGREIVGTKGLFITKKRYAILYYDKDNKRYDTPEKPGKLKAMGLDLKRADTPEYMQNFLETILLKILTDHEEQEVLKMITNFRREFNERQGWEKGTPKRVNNLAKYRGLVESGAKVTIPGHVMASLNWNTLRRMNGDRYSMEISDGMKVIFCKIRANPMSYTSVAYPIDELKLPKWFQDLPFDHEAMETTIIGNKIDNLIGVLDWDVQSTETRSSFNSLFSFD